MFAWSVFIFPGFPRRQNSGAREIHDARANSSMGLVVGVQHRLFVDARRRCAQHGDDGEDAGAGGDFHEHVAAQLAQGLARRVRGTVTEKAVSAPGCCRRGTRC